MNVNLHTSSTPLKKAASSLIDSNQRIKSLKDLLILEKQREQLQSQLDNVQKRVISLQFAIFTPSETGHSRRMRDDS